MLGDQTAQWLIEHGITLVLQFLLAITTLVIMLAFLLHAGRMPGRGL